MQTAFIMPTLGEPGWDRHLPSLLNQSCAPDQIVVVVDRPVSAAERAQFAQAWPMVTFLFNDSNLGITRSLNRALAETQAEFVFRADDDDESRPSRIEEQLACFHATNADFVASWGEGVAGDNARSYAIRCPTDNAEIRSALLKRNVLLHPSLAFRRAPIMALGGYDETFVNAQDYALYLAGLRAGLRFAAVPKPLVKRFYHAGNISVRRRANQLMYSCAARVAHHAATGDRVAFLRTLCHYGLLAGTPNWARRARRMLFALAGRGR